MNTRPVEDQLINRAIRDGYGGFPTGLHPAVSYTHLDVYKRQILTRSGLPPILPEKLRISCIYLQIIPPAANGEKPVSYTHLDVYKRQLFQPGI